MRRLVIIALVALIGWLPATAHAQTGSSSITVGSDFSIHPAIAVVAGAVTGVVLASAVAGSLITGSLMLEGASLSEALEAGTGLTIPAIGASAVLGGLLGHLLFNNR
jgi:predicted phage tail protein